MRDKTTKCCLEEETMYIITTDTAADLPLSYIEEHHLLIAPLFYRIGETTYGSEGQIMPIREFYSTMRSGAMPTTMGANPEDIKDMLRPHLERGTDVLHIAFSSALSTSYQSAVIAAQDLREEFPNRTIYIVDSTCASLGQGLLVHKALQHKDAGESIEQVHEWVEVNKSHICHAFTVDDLFHLQRGGRISKTTAIIGSLVKIKPVLHVNDNGELISLQNVRGRKKALTTLVDMMVNDIAGYEDQNDIFFISHGDCLDDAVFVAEQVKERTGIQNCIIDYVSATIASHSGPGTLALFYYGKSRSNSVPK